MSSSFYKQFLQRQKQSGITVSQINLVNIIFDAAASIPNNIALMADGKPVTYLQLASKIIARQTQLQKLGIAAGQHVGLLFYSDLNYVVNFFTLLRLQAVVVPINVRLTAHEINRIINHSDMVALISGKAFKPVLQQIQQSNPNLLVLDALQLRSSSLDPLPLVLTSVPPNTVATLVYTSGTTGDPKGVMLSHYNILADALANIDVIRGSSDDCFISVSPLFHVFGQANVMLTAFLLGARLVLLEKFSPRKVLSLIQQHGVTVLTAVPTMYQMMLSHLKENAYDLSTVRVCHSGAAAMPVSLIQSIEATFNAPLQEGYGLSEGTSMICSNPLTGTRKPGTVGVAINGVTIAIWDDNNQPLAANTIGEVVLQGDIVMQGYYKNPQATQQKIVNHWLKTGDLGSLDTEGYLTIASRKDDLINVGGVNVYPREIETVLLQHPAIQQAAVTGRPSHLYHQEVWAFLVVNKGSKKPTNDELFQYCQQFLASFKIPKHINWVADLPKTASGKIQRNKL